MVHVDTNMSSISKADLASFFRNTDVWKYMDKPEWLAFVQNHLDAQDNVNGLSLTMGGGKITGVGTPATGETTSAVPKSYVDVELGLKVDQTDYNDMVSDLETKINENKTAIEAVDTTTTWADIGAPGWIDQVSLEGTNLKIDSNVSMGGTYVIGDLLTPSLPSHATTKKYVDDAIASSAADAEAAAAALKTAAVAEAQALVTASEASLSTRSWADIEPSTVPAHLDYMFASTDASNNERTSLAFPLHANGLDISGLPVTAPTATSAVSKAHLDTELTSHTNRISTVETGIGGVYTKAQVDTAIGALDAPESSLRTAITAEIGQLDTTTNWDDMYAAGNLPDWLQYMATNDAGHMAIEGHLDLASNKLMNIAAPVDDTDAANKAYVDSVKAPDVQAEAAKQVSLLESVKAVMTPEVVLAASVSPTDGVPKSYDIGFKAGASAAVLAAVDDFDLQTLDAVLVAYKTPTDLDGKPIEGETVQCASKTVSLALVPGGDGSVSFSADLAAWALAYDDTDVVTFKATPVVGGKRTYDGNPIATAVETAITSTKFALPPTQVGGAGIVPVGSSGGTATY